MEEKIVYKIFTIADYDREAVYLKNMHGQGWKLKKVSYSPFLVAVRYTFEACLPQEVAYQLDFRPIKKAEQESYYQLFEDCGWEHITNFNQFSYFRKPVSQIDADSNLEIYNDAWCKLEMVKRLLIWRFLPAIIVLCVTAYLILDIFQKSLKASLLFKSILAIDCVILFILFCQLVHIGLNFWKMRQELKD